MSVSLLGTSKKFDEISFHLQIPTCFEDSESSPSHQEALIAISATRLLKRNRLLAACNGANPSSQSSISKPAMRDSPAIRDLVVRVLIVQFGDASESDWSERVQRWGHCAVVVRTRAFLFDTAIPFNPHVLLVELAEANHDELVSVIKQWRHSEIGSHCLIVGVMERTDHELREIALDGGFDLVLVEPVDAFHLQTLIVLETLRAAHSLPG